jgi:hypothetical protein
MLARCNPLLTDFDTLPLAHLKKQETVHGLVVERHQGVLLVLRPSPLPYGYLLPSRCPLAVHLALPRPVLS